MNIEINEATVTRAINESIDVAVAHSLKSYDVQSAISSALASELTSSLFSNAVKEAVARVDLAQLASKLAETIQRATCRAAVAILQEGMVEAIAKLHGLSPYLDEDKEQRERIRRRVFGDED